MGKSLSAGLFLGFFLFLTVFLFGFVSACQYQCSFNDGCLNVGEISGRSYCDASLSMLNQKAINASCLNDFECSSGSCIGDKCVNLTQLAQENEELRELIEAISPYGGKTNCTVSPGCYNQTSFPNGVIDSSGICVGFPQTYNCFKCDSRYEWNGTACGLKNCTTIPGCYNISLLNNVNYYQNETYLCDAGFQCIKCKSGYSWNSSSNTCYYNPSGGSSGGSGGSDWTYTKSITSTQFSQGFNMKMYEMWRIRFIIGGKEHYVGVLDILSSSAKIEVASTPRTYSLNRGEEKSFEVTKDDYYDVMVKINSISGNSVNITIKAIKDAINPTSINENQNSDEPDIVEIIGDEPTLNYKILIWIIVGILILLLLIAISFLVYYLLKKKRNNKEIKEVWKNYTGADKKKENTPYTYAYNPNAYRQQMKK